MFVPEIFQRGRFCSSTLLVLVGALERVGQLALPRPRYGVGHGVVDGTGDCRLHALTKHIRGELVGVGTLARLTAGRPVAEEEANDDTENSERQVNKVVEHGLVLVRQQPKHVGHDEAEYADKQINDA